MSSPSILIAAVAALALAVPAGAQGRDSAAAYAEAQRGKIMPLPRIEAMAREHSSVRCATYFGLQQYNEAAATYRLKFMRGRQVMIVDVDARTGRVLQTSGDCSSAAARPPRD